jgi:hypothetical protein
MRATMILFLLSLVSITLYAADISYKGFIDHASSLQLKKQGRFQTSKTRARLGFEASKDDSFLFISLDAIYNPIVESQTEVNLHEAYADYVSEKWDIRVGRQIIIWGKADGLRITDLISPTDSSEFMAFEFDDMRMPVNAIKFRLLYDNANLELVGIPVFTAGKLPGTDSPWYIGSNISADEYITTKPLTNYQSVEGAAKLSLFQPGVDLVFSAMYLWDDFPFSTLKNENGTTILQSKYYRIAVFGIEAAVPIDSFVLRSEAALYTQKKFQSSDLLSLYEKPMVNWLLGLDWYPGNNWTLSMQLSGTDIFDYDVNISNKKHTYLSTLNIQKKVFRETLTLSNMLYAGLNGTDIMERVSMDYALTDEFHLSTGIDLFFGNSDTFGRYKDNSQIWFKTKYSF